jgi:molybdopterin converting factor small subunit
VRRKKVAEIYPKLATLILDEETVALAVNEEYVQEGEDLTLKQGDTVAVIPPISGG